jgi:uncharacterized protein YjlB
VAHGGADGLSLVVKKVAVVVVPAGSLVSDISTGSTKW